MRLFKTIAGLRCYLKLLNQSKVVSVVPILEGGYTESLTLIKQAQRGSNIVVVCILVNLWEFDSDSDLPVKSDQPEEEYKWYEQLGVDVIFLPTLNELYLQKRALNADEINIFTTQVIPPENMRSVLSEPLMIENGQNLTTVVTKLLNIIKPANIYFSQKNPQRLAIIKRLVADLHLSAKIVACPILREESGLADSHSNHYLTESQKAEAPIIYHSLQQAQALFEGGECDRSTLLSAVKSELSKASELQTEYLELLDPTTLKPLSQIDQTGLLVITASFGSVRLTDNLMLVKRKPIIAIDGPAGAGKSTVTRQVAKRLGLMHLDTGAMYRAITWRVQAAGIDLSDEPTIAELVSQSQVYLTTDDSTSTGVQVWVDDKEVTQLIRSPEVTANVSAIAAIPSVRHELVKHQQRLGCQGGIVAEGRDIGTHVFPDAELKIFLTASVRERARRRQQELKEQQLIDVSLEKLEQEIRKRDLFDSNRAVAPLCKADDAVEIVTDSMSIDQVTEVIVGIFQDRYKQPI